MGIKNLNKFLIDNCTNKSIQKIHLSVLKNKTVVIDTSIYLYKFQTENALLENMYLFISILKKYKIIPIFIFDGKPPQEKMELLKQRQNNKKIAKEKYQKLEEKLETITKNKEIDTSKIKIEKEMETLKRQFTQLQENDIKNVKKLLTAYGILYYESPKEADQLCAYLTKTKKVWGCFTDDMDMFVYECPYIIRNLSLMNHTAVLYDKKSILNELEMTDKIFSEIMILSGTDYSINSKTSLKETILWFYEYNKYLFYCNENEIKPYEFYVWLIKNTKYIDDYKLLLKTYKMFILDDDFKNIEMEIMNKIENETIVKEPNIMHLQNILITEGFLFL
jgi:hypothetical protein